MTISPKTLELIRKENWRLFKGEDEKMKVEAFGKIMPARHPCLTYLKLYREENNPDLKFDFMKAAHFYLRPDLIKTWNTWTEDCFRAHCEGWNYLVLAGGASTAKSTHCGWIAPIFWLANPSKRGVIISSTTLESLTRRIWGYAMDYLQHIKVPIPFQYTGGNTPKVLAINQDPNAKIKKDTLHGMFCVAIKQGDSEKAIKDIIGTHPKDALMLILDESTDIPATVLGSFANLDTGEAAEEDATRFQVWAIGNSNSTNDLHGALATPEIGWENVDPLKMKRWKTTQKNGVCLFFSCYESPAIHEKDPAKKKLLSKFLITEEKINEKKLELGAESDAFYRFVIGFWRHKSTENVIASKQFIESFGTNEKAHYGGLSQINLVGGLDLAFSTGGDQCILRLGVLGVDVTGLYTLDFRDEELIYTIPILRTSADSADLQIGKAVMKILGSYGIPLNHIAIDATGQGRAMGGVLQLLDNGLRRPISIYSTKTGVNQADSFDVKIISTYELWYNLRDFIQAGQIRGIGNKTIMQLSERQIERMPGGKMVLESKADYKKRIGAKHPGMAHSPDHADAAALCLQSAIHNFGFSIGARREIPQVSDFNQMKWIAHNAERKAVEDAAVVRRRSFVPSPKFTGKIEALAKRKIL